MSHDTQTALSAEEEAHYRKLVSTLCTSDSLSARLFATLDQTRAQLEAEKKTESEALQDWYTHNRKDIQPKQEPHNEPNTD